MNTLQPLFFCFAILLSTGVATAAQHALLIGVSDYADARVPDLEGPIHDVAALKDMLLTHWQFDHVNVTTLINDEATESAILEALDALPSRAAPGDDLLIYFSGHGTSASDPDFGSRLNLPDGTGAIVASDFDPMSLNRQSLHRASDDGLLVGRFELKPRFQALDAHYNVLIMFDACFTGNSARTFPSPYRPKTTRQLNVLELFSQLLGKNHDDATTMQSRNDDTNTQSDGLSVEPAEENTFAYKNTVYFGAAAEDQFAVDFSQAEIDAGLVSSIDGLPHGGFTDALLRVLSMPFHDVLSTQADSTRSQSNPVELSYAQLFNRVVNQFNIHCSPCGHTPVSLPAVSDNTPALLSRPILRTGDTPVTASLPAPLDNTLIVAVSGTEGALLDRLQLDRRSISFHSNPAGSTTIPTPDITLRFDEESVLASAGDGQLIAEFQQTPTPHELQDWLTAQHWLKQRRLSDLNKERGKLRVDFRHPLQGNTVKRGDFLHFKLFSEQDANLLVLTINTKGQLAVLYPIHQREAESVLPAMQPLRIPALDDPQLQVTPPWGTDLVLFYALPVGHPIVGDMLSLSRRGYISVQDPQVKALEHALEATAINYSTSTVRIIASDAL